MNTIIEKNLPSLTSAESSNPQFSTDDKKTIFSSIFLLAILRNLIENLPFNFLINDKN